MNKSVILITGTPCTGKTTIAQQLTATLDSFYINLTELAKTHGLTVGKDKTRETLVVNEEEMQHEISKAIDTAKKATVVVDGHYAAAVVSKRYVTHVFVLRRNPVELRGFMEQRGFSDAKKWENLASEILDVCLVEALQEQGEEKVCELDVTGKTVESVVNEMCAVIKENKECHVGNVDWLSLLERDGILDEYLKF